MSFTVKDVISAIMSSGIANNATRTQIITYINSCISNINLSYNEFGDQSITVDALHLNGFVVPDNVITVNDVYVKTSSDEGYIKIPANLTYEDIITNTETDITKNIYCYLGGKERKIYFLKDLELTDLIKVTGYIGVSYISVRDEPTEEILLHPMYKEIMINYCKWKLALDGNDNRALIYKREYDTSFSRISGRTSASISLWNRDNW